MSYDRNPEDAEMIERWGPDFAEDLRDWFDTRDRIAEWGSVTSESVPPEMVDRKVRND